MEGFIKQKKGITLIALVITIVVLLILAGVTIATLMGDNGILTKANDAEVEQSHATVREALELAYNEWKIQINTSSNAKLASTETIVIQGKEENAESETTTTFFDFLVSKSYVDESTRIIDVEKLTGSKQTLGNGTGSTDVYKLNEDDNNYKLVYYGKSEEDIIDITTIAKTEEENPFIYTQEDIDKASEYVTTDIVEVTQDNIDDFSQYGEDIIGKKVAIITGFNQDYYMTYHLPFEKLVIPNKIGDADIVIIAGGIQIAGPKTIIYLNDYGIFSSSNEEYVKLPNKGTEISQSSELKYIDVDDNNSYYSSEDGILFNKEKTSIERYPINMTNTTTYTIPSNIKDIGEYAFADCTILANINIPNSVTTIGEFAFLNCTTLTNINIPNSVTSIGKFAFRDCTTLTNINIPESVTTIGEGTFSGCKSLKSITLPNNIASIEKETFFQCNSLESINIPNTVNSIGNSTFFRCTSLTNLIIPSSVISIGRYAFDLCDKLTITVEADSPLTIDDFSETGIDPNKVIFK